MYSKKKIIKYLILILAILILLVVLLTQIGDIKKIVNVFASGFNAWWLVACFGLILLYCFVYKLPLIILVKRHYKNLKFKDLYFISGSEFFFNAVTPFASGGQPFQAYALKQKNVSLADSTSDLLLNFLAYQVALNIVSGVCAIVFFNRLHSEIDNFIILFIVGFSINFLIMILLLLLGTSKTFGKALIKLISLICIIKPIKKLVGDKTDSITQYVNDMQTAFKNMKKDMLTWFLCLFIKVVANVIYYCIPFLGFYVINNGIDSKEFFYCFALTSFSLTTTIWVPLPGASGGVELAFLVLFKKLITDSGASDPDSVAQSGMLLWRFLTYYFVLIYGLIDYIIFDTTMTKELKLLQANDKNNQVNSENTDEISEEIDNNYLNEDNKSDIIK